MPNYTLHDIVGSLLATAIFPIVFLTPGYVSGWLLNVFDFRNRQLTTQHIIGIVLSNAISPISLFLLCRFTSANIALVCLFLTAIGYLFLLAKNVIRQKEHSEATSSLAIRYQKIAVWIVLLVTIFLIALLVDIQVQGRLYFSIASYDLTTRVAVVDAITRTGVPPVNPGYYPGHPAQLTYLYYFWYILGSVVDRLGGNFITAYQAMIGSVVWCVFSLIATLALYIRLRTNEFGEKKIQLPMIACQLLLISGLDFIPITMAIIQERTMFGRLPYNGHLEGWNTPIMSWANAVVWVPHHVASTLACITAMLLMIYGWRGNSQQKTIAAILSSFAFASAFGLSVWIMLTFGAFWGVWIIFLIIQKQKRRVMVIPMILAGIFGILLVSPFIQGIASSSNPNNSTGALPVALYVRPFMAIVYFEFLPRAARLLINLLFLPLNYFFEFGFFLIMVILWLQMYRKSNKGDNLFQQGELILVTTITILLSFVYSTVIGINDLGIRGWLPVQFILVVWTVDVLAPRLQGNAFIVRLEVFKSFLEPKRLGGLLSAIFIIGFLSTLTDIITVRAWPILVDLNIVGFPNELSPDTHLGERNYAGRQTYDYIREHIPGNTIIQSNPLTVLDRPGGLYGDHQMAIADRTSYGVSANEFKRMTEGIGKLFNFQKVTDWATLDHICSSYSIGAIVVSDIDPLWTSIDTLSIHRGPLYKNDYYAVFSCGK